jgi:hypothetical protein
VGGEYVLPFGFRTQSGTLDHHLVFATKNLDPAKKVMKGIMSRASSVIDVDGVGNFEFDPKASERQSSLLRTVRRLDGLKSDLLSAFSGRKIRVGDVYEEYEGTHDTPFTFKNYQDALRELTYDAERLKVEKGGFVLAESNVRHRHMHELYDLTFPP